MGVQVQAQLDDHAQHAGHDELHDMGVQHHQQRGVQRGEGKLQARK